MSGAPHSVVNEDVIKVLCALVAVSPKDGCVVEVGVYKGGTLWHLVRAAGKRPVFAYDTFSGIPFKDPIDACHVGMFNDTSFDAVRAAVPEAVYGIGVFPQSIRPMPPISFAHIDCDQYQSVKDCIQTLSPMMLPGGIMWFDDAPSLEGAKLAVEQAFPPERIETLHGIGKYFVRF